MKHAVYTLALLFVFSLIAAGCTDISGGRPVGSPERVQAKDSTGATGSSSFFYLKSRRLLAAGKPDQAELALKKAIKKDETSSFLRQELIRLYHSRDKSAEALALAEEMVQADPDNVDNLLILVRLKKGKDNTPQFLDLLRKIIQLDPDNKESYLRLGKIYMDNEDFNRALDIFTRMVERFPEYYVAYYYMAEALDAVGKTEAATVAFNKTLALEPDLVEPRFRLIELLEDQPPSPENRQKIMALFDQILEIDPGNGRAAFEAALFHYKNENKKKAEAIFADLAQRAKANPRLIMSAVDTLMTGKRYEDAVVVMTRLLKADPANANLNFFTGMAYEGLGDLDKAVEFYLNVTPDHPQFKKTILSIAFLYRDQGRPEQAIRFLEQHHSQSPADIDLLSYLASFHEEQGQYEQAMTLLQKGLKQSPENSALLFKLGTIQDKAGLRQDCINTMKQVIRMDPDNPSALNYLGYTYAEMGIHLDQAQTLVERALALKPGDGYITDSLGWVHYKKGQVDQAVYYLEKAADISGYETIIATHLGDAYVKAGRFSDALTAYKKALANAKTDQEQEIKALKDKIQDLEKQGHAAP
jgi:tetratricopeptide (TPR) repeat protein